MVSGPTSPVNTTISREEVHPNTGRLFALDFIRAVAIILVVVLHAASPIMYQVGKVPATVWDTHNLIDSAARVAVPLFFMISGYFLLPSSPAKDREPLKNIWKRVSKILIPLTMWSILYRCYTAYINGQQINYTYIIKTLDYMLHGAVVYHFWFLYELLAIYMFLPVLRKIFNESDRLAIYFISLWFFLLTSRFLASLDGWKFPLASYLDLGSTGYLVAGYLIRRHLPNPSVPIAATAGACYATATAVTFYMTEQYSLAAGSYVEAFHVYTTPVIVIMAVSAFIFLLHIGNRLSQGRGIKIRRAIENLAACSFGIYFLHVHFLERSYYNVMREPSTGALNAIIAIVATALMAITWSWVITFGLRLSRFTRWLAP